MSKGRRIVAVISKVNGEEPYIQIADNNFEVIKTKEGDICIVHKKSEKYCAVN